MDDLNQPRIIERTLKVVLSPQARKIIKEAGKSEDEFIEWSLEVNKISLGGHNVMLWLEKKYNGEI